MLLQTVVATPALESLCQACSWGEEEGGQGGEEEGERRESKLGMRGGRGMGGGEENGEGRRKKREEEGM